MDDTREILFKKYLELKAQEKEIQEHIKYLQDEFMIHDMSGFIHEDKQLIQQVRNTITLKDNIKDLLKSKGVYEACVSVDKTKVNAMRKAKIITDDEIKPYEETKISYAWTIKEIKEEED